MFLTPSRGISRRLSDNFEGVRLQFLLGDRGKGDGETADFAVHLLFLRHPAMWGTLLINPEIRFNLFTSYERYVVYR